MRSAYVSVQSGPTVNHLCEHISDPPGTGDLTTLLGRMAGGDDDAMATLWGQVQSELRIMASRLLSRESSAVTLQTTQLINEAWIRLHGGGSETTWEHRGHFFGSVSRAMGQVLIDRARRRHTQKRGSGVRPVSLSALDDPPLTPATLTDTSLEPLLLELQQMRHESPRANDVVWLRLAAGLTMPHIAAALDISERTAAHDWQWACAWLRDRLSPMA